MLKEQFPRTIYKPENSPVIIANGPLGTEIVCDYLKANFDTEISGINISAITRSKLLIQDFLEAGGVINSNGLIINPQSHQTILSCEQSSQLKADKIIYVQKKLTYQEDSLKKVFDIDSKSLSYHLLCPNFISSLTHISKTPTSILFFALREKGEPYDLSLLITSLGKLITKDYETYLSQIPTRVSPFCITKQILYDLSRYQSNTHHSQNHL